MGTPWDRASRTYVDEWVPRFVPYHTDLARELGVKEGQRVLVPLCGPGSEVIALGRAVGANGRVVATDDAPMVRVARERVAAAALAASVTLEEAPEVFVQGGPFDAVVVAFGLARIADPRPALEAWRDALTPNGKLGLMSWGPAAPDDPYEQLMEAFHECEPGERIAAETAVTDRAALSALLETAGLVLVRHTVVRHTLRFATAETFLRALRGSCTWCSKWDALGAARSARVAARFFHEVGGPDAPIAWDPPATIAIAGHPGAEIELPHRPSVRIPTAPPSRTGEG
jgi:SAM-dependent methyltransferase